MESGKQNQSTSSGSLKKSEPEFLLAGKLRKTHGLNGELYLEILTDFPQVFKPNQDVFIGSKKQKMRITSMRYAGNFGLIRFENYSTPESARNFTNQFLFIKPSILPEPKSGFFFHHQLIGMRVVNSAGLLLGEITEILETGANDVYVMLEQETRREILIPAVESVVVKIDIESQKMTVNLPEWDS